MRTNSARSRTPLLIAAGLAFALGACAERPKGTVIARVGDAELTLENARAHVDTTRGAIGFQIREYADAWTTTELLYREAVRLGLESSPEFQQQLEDVKRQLVSERYLSSVLAADTLVFSEDSMKSYYLAHAKEFLLRENMLKLRIMRCDGRERASNFAAIAVQKGSWTAAADAVQAETQGSPASYADIPIQYYSQSTLYPPELWRVAFSLGVNEVSFPVRSGDRYYVLQLLATAQQGRPADFEMVMEEVRDRMTIERRRTLHAQILGTLRSRYAVEILLDGSTPPDSSAGFTHE